MARYAPSLCDDQAQERLTDKYEHSCPGVLAVFWESFWKAPFLINKFSEGCSKLTPINMTADSYSLDEVAKILRITRRSLERRIQEGAFPGRYLAPGLYGLEMRIPVADVDRLERGAQSLQEDSELPEGRSLVRRRNVELESQSREVIESDWPEVRGEVISTFSKERELVLGKVQELMASQKEEIVGLKSELLEIKAAIGNMTMNFDKFESSWKIQTEHQKAIGDLGTNSDSEANIEELMSELADLEAMLAVDPED